MADRRCVCGCGRRGIQRHHVVYVQKLREVAGRDRARFRALCNKGSNLVWLSAGCHAAHHAREQVLPLSCLPDSVFDFAARVLEPGPAYEYLQRRYSGADQRLERLLVLHEEAMQRGRDALDYERRG